MNTTQLLQKAKRIDNEYKSIRKELLETARALCQQLFQKLHTTARKDVDEIVNDSTFKLDHYPSDLNNKRLINIITKAAEYLKK